MPAAAIRRWRFSAAIFFGDQHREISGLGQCIDERAGIGHLAIERAPVFAGELGAEFGDGVADIGIFVLLFLCGHSVTGSVSVADCRACSREATAEPSCLFVIAY